MPKTALITGVTGQDGSYLADFLLEKGYQVVGMVRRSCTENFQRIEPAMNLAEVEIELAVSTRKLNKKGDGWLVGNNQKLCSLLDWTPHYSLQQTIADTLNAWRVTLKKGIS